MKKNDTRQPHVLISMRMRIHKALLHLNSCQYKTCITAASYWQTKNLKTIVVNWVPSSVGKGCLDSHHYMTILVDWVSPSLGGEMPMLNIFKTHTNSTASARFGELDYMMLSRSLVSLTQLSAVLAYIFPQSSRGSYRKASRYRKRYIWACSLLDSVRMRFHENCDHCLCKSSISKQCVDQICDVYSKQTSRT